MATSRMGELIRRLRSTVLLGAGAEPTDGELLACFVSQREPAAIETLIRRHAPMVWSVCNRVLCNHQDAEDAFQAAFLVLVRKAASIKQRESVGNWIYGVAHQTAIKARATNAKRREREKQVGEMPEAQAVQQNQWPDLQPLLDDELSRLPEKYRAAIVLCDLQELTIAEVARRLGVPHGTVASRLARGRAMLAKRLAQRGLAVSGGTLAIMLAKNAASACVPNAVLSAAIKAATLVTAGRAVSSLVSAKVTALTEGVIKTVFIDKLKVLGVTLLTLCLLGGGVALCVPRGEAEQTVPAQPADAKIHAGRVGKNDILPDAQKILMAWNDHSDKIQSARFVWRKKQEVPRECLIDAAKHLGEKRTSKKTGGIHVSEMTCTFILDGKKARFEMRGDAPSFTSPKELAPLEQIMTFDGSASKSYDPLVGERKASQGILMGKKDSVTTASTVRELMRNFRPREVFADIANWTIGSAKGDADNRTYVTVTEPAKKPPVGFQRVIWLDPQKDFAIVRYISMDSKTKDVFEQVDIILTRDKNAGWIPSQWTVTERLNATTKGTVSSKVSEYSLNTRPEGGQFRLEFPPGTVIIDQSK